jgi:two-component system sensor histidine kinase KdpD
VTVIDYPERDTRIDRCRELAEQLGSTFTVLGGPDVAEAIVQAARDAGSEHVVLGEVVRGGWRQLLRPSIVDRVIDELPEADIHVIARVSA